MCGRVEAAITVRAVSGEELDQAREAGRAAAEAVLNSQAPAEPLLRIAWADGYGQVDLLHDAVMEARAAGATWRDIGDVLGMHFRTAQSKFGQPDRHRRYAERQRAKEQGER